MFVDDFMDAPAVVIGGGIAGLSTALALKGCILVANEAIGGGASRLAQGGIAAALDHDDSPALHAADTLRVSVGLADPEIAALVTKAAIDRVDWLRAIGVAFDRSPAGALALGREAGHGRNRIVHAGGDRTGAAVMRAMREAVLKRDDIRVLEGFELVDLVTADNRAAGVLLEGPGGLRLAVLAPQVVLATGGIGACFNRTTTPPTSRGAGLAAATRCGVRLADLEFVQFHPTALAVDADPLPLLTEALRGAGAVLLDESGDRFMASIHPDAELAPRDVVARSVFAINARGKQVFLDATSVRSLATRFPGACALAGDAGLDAMRQPLPVTTAAHFHMGGIATDAQGATSMLGLWACGEVASTGLHGGNRLASNSLLEGLVFGERIARAIRTASLSPAKGSLEVPRRVRAAGFGGDRIAILREQIGNNLGPLRSGPAMTAALRWLDSRTPATRAEEDLTVVARQLLLAALGRCESRGSHQRSDFPRTCESGAATPIRTVQRPEPVPTVMLELLRSHVA
jgi:L-aspartate oxidase